MEVTNILINQQSSVSINIETLQAIKQRLWFMVKGAWLRVLCLAKRKSRAKGSMSLPRLYRKELRAANWMERVASEHPTLFNIVLGLLGIFLTYQVVNYNFTTSL